MICTQYILIPWVAEVKFTNFQQQPNSIWYETTFTLHTSQNSEIKIKIGKILFKWIIYWPEPRGSWFNTLLFLYKCMLLYMAMGLVDIKSLF
jgi:hypothetical protein